MLLKNPSVERLLKTAVGRFHIGGQSLKYLIRRAHAAEADAIRALGLADTSFQVSERIPFYEAEELMEWANSPSTNLLFVAESAGVIHGFFFCKVMSRHWAMLDNFYVAPEVRGKGIGSRLLAALTEHLVGLGTSYLSILVALDDLELSEQMLRFGFDHAKKYGWMEMMLPPSIS